MVNPDLGLLNIVKSPSSKTKRNPIQISNDDDALDDSKSTFKAQSLEHGLRETDIQEHHQHINTSVKKSLHSSKYRIVSKFAHYLFIFLIAFSILNAIQTYHQMTTTRVKGEFEKSPNLLHLDRVHVNEKTFRVVQSVVVMYGIDELDPMQGNFKT